MNHDTVLRACEKARLIVSAPYGTHDKKYFRQYLKFHDWLVRRDARLTMELAVAKGQVEFWKYQAQVSERMLCDELEAKP